MKKIYLFLIASGAGVQIVLGLVVAAVIFNANNWLGAGVLSREQSGILMTQIFVRSNYFLLFLAIFAFIYELFNKMPSTNLRISRLFVAFINLACIAAFGWYFAPNIIKMQQSGLANDASFMQIHSASELVYKIAALCLLVLFFTNKLDQSKSN